jgi:hypothetical protein
LRQAYHARISEKIVLTTREIRRLETRDNALLVKLGSLHEISQGSVMPQAPRAWRWTRKVAGKTVSTLGVGSN